MTRSTTPAAVAVAGVAGVAVVRTCPPLALRSSALERSPIQSSRVTRDVTPCASRAHRRVHLLACSLRLFSRLQAHTHGDPASFWTQHTPPPPPPPPQVAHGAGHSGAGAGDRRTGPGPPAPGRAQGVGTSESSSSSSRGAAAGKGAKAGGQWGREQEQGAARKGAAAGSSTRPRGRPACGMLGLKDGG